MKSTWQPNILGVVPAAYTRIILVTLAVLSLSCSLARRPAEGEVVLEREVEARESIESIADEYYGDPDRAGDILKFNKIGEDDIVEGVNLLIPMTPDEMKDFQVHRAATVPYNAGVTLAARGDFLDATVNFRRAIELDPEYAAAHYNLGVTYQRMKSMEAARDMYERAVNLRPRNADYLYSLGNVEFYLGKFDRAARSFRKALKYKPDHLKSAYSLALSLEKDGKTEAARQAWLRYLELDSDSEWAREAHKYLDRSTE